MYEPEFSDQMHSSSPQSGRRRRPQQNSSSTGTSIPVTRQRSGEGEENDNSSKEGNSTPRIVHIPIQVEGRDHESPRSRRNYEEGSRAESIPKDNYENRYGEHRERAGSVPIDDFDSPWLRTGNGSRNNFDKHFDDAEDEFRNYTSGRVPRNNFEKTFEDWPSAANTIKQNFEDWPRLRAWSGNHPTFQRKSGIRRVPVNVQNDPRENFDHPLIRKRNHNSAASNARRDESTPSPPPHISKVFVNNEEPKPEMDEEYNKPERATEEAIPERVEEETIPERVEEETKKEIDESEEESEPKEDSEEIIYEKLMNKIKHIEEDIEKWTLLVEEFSEDKKSKRYRYLDEMLTRCMLQLDNVDTEGIEEIRQARKAAINNVQIGIAKLESKASENEQAKVSEPQTEVRMEESNQQEVPLKEEKVLEQVDQQSQVQQPEKGIEQSENLSSEIEYSNDVNMDQDIHMESVEESHEEKPEEEKMEIEKCSSEVTLLVNQDSSVPQPVQRAEIQIDLENQ